MGRQAYVLVFCQAHRLVEALPAIIAPDCIPLVVSDMTIGSDEDTYRIRSYLESKPDLCPGKSDGIFATESSLDSYLMKLAYC